MATPDRDNLYTSDGSRTVYTREGSGTGWFVGIIVALALLAIGYLVFAANTGGPATTTINTDGAPLVETPMTDPALTPAPMTEAPVIGTEPAPVTEAPAPEAAPPVTELPAEGTAPVIQ